MPSNNIIECHSRKKLIPDKSAGHYDFTDGCGMMSEGLARCDLQLSYIYSMWWVRLCLLPYTSDLAAFLLSQRGFCIKDDNFPLEPNFPSEWSYSKLYCRLHESLRCYRKLRTGSAFSWSTEDDGFCVKRAAIRRVDIVFCRPKGCRTPEVFDRVWPTCFYILLFLQLSLAVFVVSERSRTPSATARTSHRRALSR